MDKIEQVTTLESLANDLSKVLSKLGELSNRLGVIENRLTYPLIQVGLGDVEEPIDPDYGHQAAIDTILTELRAMNH